jgi:hypothetical protein
MPMTRLTAFSAKYPAILTRWEGSVADTKYTPASGLSPVTFEGKGFVDGSGGNVDELVDVAGNTRQALCFYGDALRKGAEGRRPGSGRLRGACPCRSPRLFCRRWR